MAKIYYRKYKQRIDRRELTLEGAVALVNAEVPVNWRDDVIAMLKADYE